MAGTKRSKAEAPVSAAKRQKKGEQQQEEVAQTPAKGGKKTGVKKELVVSPKTYVNKKESRRISASTTIEVEVEEKPKAVASKKVKSIAPASPQVVVEEKVKTTVKAIPRQKKPIVLVETEAETSITTSTSAISVPYLLDFNAQTSSDEHEVIGVWTQTLFSCVLLTASMFLVFFIKMFLERNEIDLAKSTNELGHALLSGLLAILIPFFAATSIVGISRYAAIPFSLSSRSLQVRGSVLVFLLSVAASYVFLSYR